MILYHDITVASGFNGGQPGWFRAAKAIAASGTRPAEFVYVQPWNLDPAVVKQWASARNGTGIPLVNDDEGVNFSFNLGLWQSDKAECLKRIENHRRWLEAAKAGAPDSEIASWYITPPPLGTNSTIGLAEFEAAVAPLIALNDFGIRDIYASTSLTFETWKPYLHDWIRDCKKWGKEPVPTICPVFADTGQACPWFEDQLRECASLVERAVAWVGVAQDIPDLGPNLEVIRRYAMADSNSASLPSLPISELDRLKEIALAQARDINAEADRRIAENNGENDALVKIKEKK